MRVIIYLFYCHETGRIYILTGTLMLELRYFVFLWIFCCMKTLYEYQALSVHQNMYIVERRGRIQKLLVIVAAFLSIK